MFKYLLIFLLFTTRAVADTDILQKYPSLGQITANTVDSQSTKLNDDSISVYQQATTTITITKARIQELIDDYITRRQGLINALKDVDASIAELQEFLNTMN